MSDEMSEMIRGVMDAIDARDAQEASALGISIDELHEQRAAEESERAAEERARELFELRSERISPMRAGLTPVIANAICRGEISETETIAEVRRWLADPDSRPIMVLTGFTGTGKTVAAAWALGQVGGEYVRAVQLAERHTPYSGDIARNVRPLDPSAGELLVLDDLGTERRNSSGDRDPRFMPALFDVIDQRQGSMRRGTRWIQRRTLITSNLSIARFREEYAKDERIASRLAQSARVHGCGKVDLRRAEVVNNGRNMRRGGAK